MSVVKRFYRKLNYFDIQISDWEILDQGVTVLWGPSGAGKSTLLNGLLGLDPKAIVDWDFKGESMQEMPPEKRCLGVVFQDPALFPHMTAKRNILFPVDKKRHLHWADDFQFLVEHLELQHLLNSPIHQLSGGEKQRVAIARSMIYRPRLLLLDEPFSSLDEGIRYRVRAMLKEVCSYYSCPLLLVTHDRGDVYHLGTKICPMDKGQLGPELTPEEFRQQSEKVDFQ